MRHAEADFTSRDFDRPLTPWGRDQATAEGKKLVSKGLIPNLIIYSAAQRTTETMNLVSASMTTPKQASRELYNSHPKTILEVINNTDDSIETLLLIAHNPGISIIANKLCSDNAYYGFSPSDWHVLNFETNHWSEVCIVTGIPENHE
jgi:phosphohistidine phosphatase